MRSPIIYLALIPLPAFAGSFDVSIRLYNQFQRKPPVPVVESIQEELDDIMRPAGLRFDWHSLPATRGEVSVELAIIHFNGQCDAFDLQPTDGYPGPLGWTYVTSGEVIPFVGINCDGVRIFLQQDLLGLPESARASIYGRALARVLAHELYHVFAGTTKHGSFGIAKGSYRTGELLSNEFRFSKKQCDVLRAHGAYLQQQLFGRYGD